MSDLIQTGTGRYTFTEWTFEVEGLNYEYRIREQLGSRWYDVEFHLKGFRNAWEHIEHTDQMLKAKDAIVAHAEQARERHEQQLHHPEKRQPYWMRSGRHG